jgi:phospholipid/cholesterol/gamma-HCH transport system substrate-binding protein
MSRALREHLRDVLAIVGLVAAGLLSLIIILIGQRTEVPSWVPAIGSDRFELKAEFSSAQAVTPGQGQSVDIAGIKVGDVTGVELVDGHAVVTMEVENEYAPLINEDASLLLRPKTGLNDMVIQVDTGVSDQDVEEGSTIPLASTLPNVNPDEFLAALDADTQSFLRLLLAGGAEALDPEKGRDLKASAAFRQFEPFARDISRINGALAVRRENIRSAIHNFQLVSTELGDNDQDLTAFVDASNASLARFANQEGSIRAALRELPGTLEATKSALTGANEFAIQSTQGLRKSLPGARALQPALEATGNFFQQTVAPIRDQIRPFTKQAIGPITNLRKGTQGLGNTVPGLRVGFTRLNEGFNALAANPSGADESYLFYVPWLNHTFNLLYTTQDAHGPLRRGMLQTTCATSQLAQGTFQAVPFLFTAAELTTFPDPPELPGC